MNLFITRYFSLFRFVQRTLLIPFNEYERQKLGVIGKLMFSHTLTTEMGPKASALFPQFLELEEVIKMKNVEKDPLMKGLEKTLLGKELFHVSDLRSDKNYALMMFFTGKVGCFTFSQQFESNYFLICNLSPPL